jgi:hypothetical protein
MLKKKVWAVVGATPNTEKPPTGSFTPCVLTDMRPMPSTPTTRKWRTRTKCYACLDDLPASRTVWIS